MALKGNKIRGVTIEIGADTDAFVKSIKALDGALKTTNSSLKDINKLLKLDPGNTDLLKQKYEALNSSITNTKQRLNELKDAYAKSTDPQQQQALSREIVETEGKLKSLEKEMKEFGSVSKQQLQAVGDKFQEVGAKMESAGRSMTTKISLPIIAGFTASTKAAMDWETAFTGVTKTVDFESEEQKKIIEQQLKDLAKVTTSSMEEIAAVGEIGGQLGIGAEDIVEFTKVMVELGDTTSLSADAAAVALARIMNITGDSKKDVEKLGSVIVDLGNNFATTETEIAEMANRLAAGGTLAGLTSSQILALAAAMSSVGIRAEAGGTAMTQILTKIDKRVDSFNAGTTTALDSVAKVADMTSEEFAKLWDATPDKALQAFIKGLSTVEERGTSVNMAVSELGMSGIREANTLKSLALAADMFSDTLATANEAYEENTALSAEAEKRYATFESKLNQFKETIKEAAITIGEVLTPVLETLMNAIAKVAEWFTGLDDSTKMIIVAFAGIIAAIGPLLITIGKISTGVGALIKIFSSLGIVLTGGTVAAIAAVVAAVVAAGILIYKNWDKIKEGLQKLWDYVKPTFEKIKEHIVNAWQWVIDHVGPLLQALYDFIKVIWDGAKAVIIAVLDVIKARIKIALEAIKLLWSMFGEGLMNQVKIIWETVKKLIESALKIIQGVIKTITGIISGDWKKAWEGIKDIAKGVWDAIGAVIKGAINTVTNIINTGLNAIKKFFNGAWDGIKSLTSNVWNGILNTITGKMESAKNTVSNMISAIKNLFNFQLSFPHIKLPHFRVSGGFGWSWDGGLQVPHISVDWYKKAQNQPYLFNSPSIIGVGDVPEVVVGAEYFKNLTKGTGTSIVNNINVQADVRSDADIQVLANKISDTIQLSVERKVAAWR